MKKEVWFVIIGIVFIVALLVVASMIPEKKEKKIEEDLLGISYDVEGNEHEDDFEGFESTVLCHEIDHLDGILHIDIADKVMKAL